MYWLPFNGAKMRANFLKYVFIIFTLIIFLGKPAHCQNNNIKSISIDYSRDLRFLPYKVKEITLSKPGNAGKTVRDHIQIWHGNKSPFGKPFLVTAWNPSPISDEPASVCYLDFDMKEIYDQDPISVSISSLGLYQDNNFDGEAVVLGCYRNDSAFAARIMPGTDSYQFLYLISGEDQTGNGSWDPGVNILLVDDYDYDGVEETFIQVCPGRDLSPRQLYCLDMEHLKIEWSLPVAGPIGKDNFFSCRDSLDPSVIFTTYNTKNGTRDSNFTDLYCQLARINFRGEIEFNKLLSEEYGGVMLRTSKLDSIYYVSHSLPFSYLHDTLFPSHTSYFISSIGRNGEIIEQNIVRERIQDMWVDKFNCETPCLYTLTEKGGLRIYNSTLYLRGESNPTNLVRMIGTMKLGDRKALSYIFGTGNGTDLYSFDFKRLASIDFDADSFYYLTDPLSGKPGKIMLIGSRSYAIIDLERKGLFDYTKIFFWEYQNYVTLFLFLLLVALFITGLQRLRTIKELKTSRRNLDSLFKSNPEASVYTDAEGIIIDINQRFENLFGYNLQELKGKDICEIIVPPQEIIGVRERLRDLKSPIAYEAARRKKDGSMITIRLSASPIESNDGILGYIGQYKDITEIKSAQESLKENAARFRALFEDSPIMLAEEDYSEVMLFINNLRNSGIDDIEAYLLSNPDMLEKCESMIKLLNVNKTALATYGAKNIHELKTHFCQFPSQGSQQSLARVLARFAQGDKKFETELVTRDLSGKELHTYVKVSVAPGDESSFAKVFISLLDITELKEAEIALRYSEEKYRLLIEGVTSDISLIDRNGKVLFINDSFARSFGKNKEELVGKYIDELLPADDLNHKLENIIGVIETGKEFKEESSVHINNELKWFFVNIQPYQDPSGQVTCALVITYDITDRKFAERQVIASQERLRAIINSIDDLIFVIDRYGKFTFFEQAGKDDTLYSEPANYIGKHISEVMPAKISRMFDSHFKQIEADGLTRQMDYSLSIKDDIRWFSAKLSALHGSDCTFEGVTVVVREITTQVRASGELKNERDFNRSILETANSLIVCLDNMARIKIFNDECEKVTGYKRDEVLGKNWPEIFLPEYYRHEGLNDFKAWVSNHPRDSYEGPIVTKTGEERTILWSNSAIFDPISGDVTAIAIGQDITLKKRVEEAHRRSERRLRTQFKTFPIPSYTWKKEADDFILADFNDAAFKITNGKIGSVRGIKLSELYEDKPELIRDLHECFQDKTSKLREIDYTYQTTGQKKYLIVNYAFVSPDLVMVFTQDISDLKKVRQEKERQGRDIAGGFAHEIRNALFPAKGAISLLSENQGAREPVHRNVLKYHHMINDSLNKAIDITNQISQFTRMDSEYFPEKVRMSNIIRKVVDANILQIEENGIKVVYDGPEDVEIQSNSSQFYRVINNLLLNSIDALTKTEKPAILLNWKQIDSETCLEFTDNGEGISEENLSRVFDAFYSTKPNNGTGIGLAMAKKIVEMYEGFISVTSELQKGTTFFIRMKSPD